MIRVYDSLTRRLVPLMPRVPGQIGIYTCGVTPYDHSHLGHARPAVVWDVIRKHLRRRGYVVTYVQNFTDIDDKIIARARETGTAVRELARGHMAEYHDMLNRLGVEPPDFAPRVTDNIEAIIAYVEKLVRDGHAYAAPHGVYFRVRQDEEYGRLSGRKLEDMVEGSRIELEPEKEYPGDFALWKVASGQDEPAWPSPWGPGRPGWHIECSAMSFRYLGSHFDMHGGGMDLLFPHHENERAQSRAYQGDDPVSVWVHSGLITRDGVKMSKSLGNGAVMGELLLRYSAPVLRTYLLSAHYRKPLEFDEERISQWGRGLERVQRLWEEVGDAPAPDELLDAAWARHLVGFETRFLEALDDDFNTARAFAEVYDTVTAAYQGLQEGVPALARGLARRNLMLADNVLGFLNHREKGTNDDSLLEAVVRRRDEARQQRNFVLADALRQILTEAGYEVLDGQTGSRLRQSGTGAGKGENTSEQ